jgi:hypothetical protein
VVSSRKPVAVSFARIEGDNGWEFDVQEVDIEEVQGEDMEAWEEDNQSVSV